MSEATRDAMAKRIEGRRRDLEFRAVLKRSLRRHLELLKMLADG